MRASSTLLVATRVAAVCLALSMSGCLAAAMEEKRLGQRTEATEGYERAIRTGETLLVSYCVRQTFGSHGGPSGCRPKWSAIDLTTLRWRPLTTSEWKRFLGELGDIQHLAIRDAPRPVVSPGMGDEIPILAPGVRDLDPATTVVERLRAESMGRPLSAYRLDPEVLILVTPGDEGAGDLPFAAARDAYREYLT